MLPKLQSANVAQNVLGQYIRARQMQNAFADRPAPSSNALAYDADMDWTPYAVGGAAARDDSFTGLDPEFAASVYGMVQDAHEAGIPLQITSAYRSPEVQARLYENALAKYGSPEAARKWVAPPGRSKHNSGEAVDFALDGSLIREADSEAAQWIAANAAKYGLSVPMSWEPWQVEPIGSRG